VPGTAAGRQSISLKQATKNVSFLFVIQKPRRERDREREREREREEGGRRGVLYLQRG
jgi:hypothetical protein